MCFRVYVFFQVKLYETIILAQNILHAILFDFLLSSECLYELLFSLNFFLAVFLSSLVLPNCIETLHISTQFMLIFSFAYFSVAYVTVFLTPKKIPVLLKTVDLINVLYITDNTIFCC